MSNAICRKLRAASSSVDVNKQTNVLYGIDFNTKFHSHASVNKTETKQ